MYLVSLTGQRKVIIINVLYDRLVNLFHLLDIFVTFHFSLPAYIVLSLCIRLVIQTQTGPLIFWMAIEFPRLGL